MRLTACVWICEWRLKKKMLYLSYHIALWHAVQGAVSLLSARTTLLDHVQVEHIEGRLTSLNTKLAQITDKKDALESTEKQNKVINTFTFSSSITCTLKIVQLCSVNTCCEIIFWYLKVHFPIYVVQHKLCALRCILKWWQFVVWLQISELYDMMKKWDGLSSTLPQVVERLTALNQLHQQGMTSRHSGSLVRHVCVCVQSLS